MAIAVLWLVFGYVVSPTSAPGTPQTGRNLSNMDFAGLAWTFLYGMGLVAACVLIGLAVAKLWPKRTTDADDE